MKMKIYAPILTLLILFHSSCASNHYEKGETRVRIETNYGDMLFRLYDETPLHRDNFIKLAQEGYFDDLLFHRVINQFMIQGGDPQSKGAATGQRLGNGGPGYTINAEINPEFFHKKGVLAAARQGDNTNPKKRSSGSQFYIVQGKVFTEAGLDSMEMQMNDRRARNIRQSILREHQAELNKFIQTGQRDSLSVRMAELNEAALQKINDAEPYKIDPERRKVYTTAGGYPSLDEGYTIFGEMIEGFDVLDRIAAVKTDRFNRPKEDIKMKVNVLK